MKHREKMRIAWAVICLFVILSMIFSAFAFGF
jgi:hypothetical protein